MHLEVRGVRREEAARATGTEDAQMYPLRKSFQHQWHTAGMCKPYVWTGLEMFLLYSGLWLVYHLCMFMLWNDTVLLLKVTALNVAIFLSYYDIGMACPGLSLIGLLCYCPKHNQSSLLMPKFYQALANQSRSRVGLSIAILGKENSCSPLYCPLETLLLSFLNLRCLYLLDCVVCLQWFCINLLYSCTHGWMCGFIC